MTQIDRIEQNRLGIENAKLWIEPNLIGFARFDYLVHSIWFDLKIFQTENFDLGIKNATNPTKSNEVLHIFEFCNRDHSNDAEAISTICTFFNFLDIYIRMVLKL